MMVNEPQKTSRDLRNISSGGLAKKIATSKFTIVNDFC